MTEEQRLQEIMTFGGFTSRKRAQLAIDAVMRTVAELLDPEGRQVIAEWIPEPWKRSSSNQQFGEVPVSVDDFLERVALRESVPPQFAAEHVQAVVQPLMAELDPDQRGHLMRRFGDQYRDLFEPVSRLESPPQVPRKPLASSSGFSEHIGRRKLSVAEPGSQHALNDSENVSTKGNLVHRRSIARE